MNPRRKVLALVTSLAVLAAVAWTLAGGMTVAQGQENPIVIKRAHAGSFRPNFSKPIFILALGSDSGTHLFHRGGRPEKGRADSIHIIAINPRLKKATIVGIPRDSYVPLACGSSPNKINAAMFFGGPDCMVRTIENLSGGRIRFDFYMVGGFDQLVEAVSELGGVVVNVEPGLRGTLRDHNSRATGIRRGTQTLDGRKALAYSRDRHDYGRGDFDRTKHQGQVLVGALTKARKLVGSDPGKTLDFLRIMFRNMSKSSFTSLIDAFRIGLLALQLSPADVTNTFLNGGTGTTSAGSSVLLSNPRHILDNVADDAVID